MMLRPPRMNSSKVHDSALDYEIAQEQAAALGRLGRALEAALAALSEHDGLRADSGDLSPSKRRQAPPASACCGRQATPCGALSSSARRSDCAINERSCANIEFPSRCKTGWGRLGQDCAFAKPEAVFARPPRSNPFQSFVHPLAAMLPC
jgi:hypothetical protein